MSKTKFKPCPFCGSRNVRRDSWGEGFHLAVHRYIGTVTCKSCGGSIRKELMPCIDTPARECHSEVRKIATEAWNNRASEEN